MASPPPATTPTRPYPAEPLSPRPLSPGPAELESRLQEALGTIRHQNQELDKAARYRTRLNSEKGELLTELSQQKHHLRHVLDEVWTCNSDGEDAFTTRGGLGVRTGRPAQTLRRATTYQTDTQRLMTAQRETQDLKTRLARSEVRLSEFEAKYDASVAAHHKATRKWEAKLQQAQQTQKNTQKTVDMLHEERERLVQRHHKEVKLIRERHEREVAEHQAALAALEARHEQTSGQLKVHANQLEAQLRMVQMQKCSLEENVHELAREYTEKMARIEELEQLVELGDQYREQFEQQTEAMEALQAELEDSRARLQMRLTPQVSPAASHASLNTAVSAAGPGNQTSFIRAEYPFVEVSDDEYIQSQGRGPRRPRNHEQRLVRRAVTQNAHRTSAGSSDDPNRPNGGSGPALNRPMAHRFDSASVTLQSQKEALQRETDRLIQTLGAAISARSVAIFAKPWGKTWLSRSRSSSHPPSRSRDQLWDNPETAGVSPSDHDGINSDGQQTQQAPPPPYPGTTVTSSSSPAPARADKSSGPSDTEAGKIPPTSAPAKLPSPAKPKSVSIVSPTPVVPSARSAFNGGFDYATPSPPPGGFTTLDFGRAEDGHVEEREDFGAILGQSMMDHVLDSEFSVSARYEGATSLRRRTVGGGDRDTDRTRQRPPPRRRGGRGRPHFEESLETDEDGALESALDAMLPMGVESLAFIKANDDAARRDHHDQAPVPGTIGLPDGLYDETEGDDPYRKLEREFPGLPAWLIRTPLLKVAQRISATGTNPLRHIHPAAHTTTPSATRAAGRSDAPTRAYHSAPNSVGRDAMAPLSAGPPSTVSSPSPSRPLASYERLIRWLLRFLSTLYRWFKFVCFLICGFALVLLEGPNGTFGKRYIS
ncbi:hypothetical protein IWQ60_006798 [Tieghemiomyces parasiticus]|uniref:Uncharacterized protein n=1 Tax=Tieghemiomyces parasiticus TaxID=78921 RepID=A0A9W8A2V6_9FUNG|nr:hypothetical protein IWQ60_006798 [Tieghemiomyces parasiticus]